MKIFSFRDGQDHQRDARVEVRPEPGLDGGRPRGDACGLVEVDLGVSWKKAPSLVTVHTGLVSP